MIPIFQVGTVFIPVTNFELSKKWYEEKLGAKKIDEWKNGFEQGAGYYFSNGETQLSLIKVEKPQPTEFTIKGKRKNGYFNFVVEDIENIFNRLKSKGVHTTEIENYGDMQGFDFFDLDGNPFSIVSMDPHSPYHPNQVKKRQEDV